MLKVRAYNNDGKTLLYSVETYRLSGEKYFAVTSDSIKRVLSNGAESWVRPLSEGDTREEAITHLKHSISVMTGVQPDNQSFIAIRHHDDYACYYCNHFPKYESYEDWRHHFVTVHTPTFDHPIGFPVNAKV